MLPGSGYGTPGVITLQWFEHTELFSPELLKIYGYPNWEEFIAAIPADLGYHLEEMLCLTLRELKFVFMRTKTNNLGVPTPQMAEKATAYWFAGVRAMVQHLRHGATAVDFIKLWGIRLDMLDRALDNDCMQNLKERFASDMQLMNALNLDPSRAPLRAPEDAPENEEVSAMLSRPVLSRRPGISHHLPALDTEETEVRRMRRRRGHPKEEMDDGPEVTTTSHDEPPVQASTSSTTNANSSTTNANSSNSNNSRDRPTISEDQDDEASPSPSQSPSDHDMNLDELGGALPPMSRGLDESGWPLGWPFSPLESPIVWTVQPLPRDDLPKKYYPLKYRPGAAHNNRVEGGLDLNQWLQLAKDYKKLSAQQLYDELGIRWRPIGGREPKPSRRNQNFYLSLQVVSMFEKARIRELQEALLRWLKNGRSKVQADRQSMYLHVQYAVVARHFAGDKWREDVPRRGLSFHMFGLKVFELSDFMFMQVVLSLYI